MTHTDPVYSVTLSVSNLAKSMQYWNQLLGMNIYSQSETSAMLGYGDNQVQFAHSSSEG